MGLRYNVDNLRLREPLSGNKKTEVNNTVDLYSYLRFYGNIMCTAGPNNNLGLTEATGMDPNGFVVLNNGNFAVFFDYGGCCGSTWGQHEELEILYLR